MLNKPVIATGDAHFLEEEQEPVRDIALAVRGNRFDHSKGPIYLKTTEEMLADFEWVDSEIANDLVIHNPNAIAQMCSYNDHGNNFYCPQASVNSLEDFPSLEEIEVLVKSSCALSKINSRVWETYISFQEERIVNCIKFY